MSRGFLFVASSFVVPLLAQSQNTAPATVDQSLLAVRAELYALFERPAGQPIAEQQQQGLRDFLARHSGKDLGPYGYAPALEHYFRRDAKGGAAALDKFFARYQHIEHPEHAAMAGRIYLLAWRDHGEDAALPRTVVHGWAEHAAACFPELDVLSRLVPGLLADKSDLVELRLSLARGILRSAADANSKDRFLAGLYTTGSAAGGELDVVPGRAPLAADRLPNAGKASARPGPEPGKLAPAIPVEHALNVTDEFLLSQFRGKVVVLDFFATWCPPCRTGIPELQKLVQQHGETLQLIGVSRFYGRGMEFAAGSQMPHGGKPRSELDREAEIAINEAFCRAFGIDYPVILTTEEALQDFGITAIPTSFVIGKDGTIVGKVLGSGEEAIRKLRQLVQQASR